MLLPWIYFADITEENFFTSIHNAVYFAIRVLENQLR
jgi:hypothetical protein